MRVAVVIALYLGLIFNPASAATLAPLLIMVAWYSLAGIRPAWQFHQAPRSIQRIFLTPNGVCSETEGIPFSNSLAIVRSRRFNDGEILLVEDCAVAGSGLGLALSKNEADRFSQAAQEKLAERGFTASTTRMSSYERMIVYLFASESVCILHFAGSFWIAFALLFPVPWDNTINQTIGIGWLLFLFLADRCQPRVWNLEV
ncbi:MAG: hypothetical protein ACI8W8_001846 [Rhodothermales bacterium]|jgi:hypothetical protein